MNLRRPAPAFAALLALGFLIVVWLLSSERAVQSSVPADVGTVSPNLYLPLVMKPEPTATPTLTPTPTITPTPTSSPTPNPWVTITQEDFEGTVPGPGWEIASNSEQYYWAKSGCRPYTGSFSGWPMGGGTGGYSCGSNYPDNASIWLVYGPFSLVGATAGDLSFKLWLNTEGTNDGLVRMASLDGNNFTGYRTSGNSQGWIDRTLDLTNVGSMGSLMGQPNVWIGLLFTSNGGTDYPEGAYVDNIVLRKYVPVAGAAASPPAPTPGQPASLVGSLTETPHNVMLGAPSGGGTVATPTPMATPTR